mmetsp:Transcript_6609/g.23328  ORF Transcript_6609/g.23328 Transcript_6609/m.23328 type:complete len:93 (+) Transcript_6609:2468-2746(+)
MFIVSLCGLIKWINSLNYNFGLRAHGFHVLRPKEWYGPTNLHTRRYKRNILAGLLADSHNLFCFDLIGNKPCVAYSSFSISSASKFATSPCK